MDRRGPRVVNELGVVLIGTGLLLATLVSAAVATLRHARHAGWCRQRLPWLYRPGTVSAELVCPPARPGHEHRVLRCRRGFGHPVAVAAGLIERSGWRSACSRAGCPRPGAVAAAQPAAAARPQDIGLHPDGDRTAHAADAPAGVPMSSIRLGRNRLDTRAGVAHGQFLVDRTRVLLALFAWYAVQVHQTKYLMRSDSPQPRCLGVGRRQSRRHSGPDRARPSRPIGSAASSSGAWGASASPCYLLLLLLRETPTPALLYLMIVAQGALGYGITR